jgi:hypothetical protein
VVTALVAEREHRVASTGGRAPVQGGAAAALRVLRNPPAQAGVDLADPTC